MQRVDVSGDFALPVERIYEFCAEHEKFLPLVGAKVKRLTDGTDSRNGVGSSRQLTIIPGQSFVETITKAVPNELIEYKITKGSPLKNHVGTMTFTSKPDGGTHVHYVIEFDAAPGLAQIVRFGLSNRITAAFKKLDKVA